MLGGGGGGGGDLVETVYLVLADIILSCHIYLFKCEVL